MPLVLLLSMVILLNYSDNNYEISDILLKQQGGVVTIEIMIKQNVQTKVLPNGLTIIAIDLPHFHSITNLLVIRSGSRYEDASINGLAHFLEHMVFKGTKSFNSS